MDIDTTVAFKVIAALRNEQFAEIETLFAPPLRAIASKDSLQAAWAAEINKSGTVVSVGKPASENIKPGLVRFSIPIIQEHGGLTVHMSVDKKGMLQGFRLAPAMSIQWTSPAYSNSKKFTEEEVSIEVKTMPVKGTLSLPKGDGPYPAVVLLSGGGPFDRDETHGPNKPLKDIAWGLASQGIATLRFDKATYSHAEVASQPHFTMREEYVPHSIASIHMLQKHPSIDTARIFLLGHSMGGKASLRVAAEEPSVAGLILLGADAQPMQRAAVRVAQYLATLNPNESNKKAVEIIAQQSRAVDKSSLSASTQANTLPFGFSGSYWLDMRSYDPLETAAKLNKPMFIAQGGRDYQVTVKDDFSLWKTKLDKHHDVTFRVYPADNHLFFPGEGRSRPDDYDQPQHVDVSVVKDIANWIKPSKGIIAWLRSRL